MDQRLKCSYTSLNVDLQNKYYMKPDAVVGITQSLCFYGRKGGGKSGNPRSPQACQLGISRDCLSEWKVRTSTGG